MTTLDLNTALANLTPGNTLREEAFIAISAHLRSAALRASFGSYRGVAHDDAVQEALHALLRRDRPILARSASAYLYTVLANAYKALAGAETKRRQEEVLHFEGARALQERHAGATSPEVTSKGHAIAEYTDGMPTLAAAMFDVNIDAILLDHLCSSIVGLMATGGSTNLVLHLPAMARAAGVELELEDFDAISSVVPLMAKVYPNGLADVNHFHAAGGLGFMIGELLDAGLLHDDTTTVMGSGLAAYAQEPKIKDGTLVWEDGAKVTQNDKILRPVGEAFQPTGGLKQMYGNLGHGMMKVSAVAPERHIIEAPARVFHDQASVKQAFKNGEFTSDTVIVVRFQGPKSNGMPELHGLTPTLAVLQDRGLKVALVTDGRMSGASGKVPSAIHISPEAAAGGPLAKLRDGDIVRVDATNGRIEALVENFDSREAVVADLTGNGHGVGRELFEAFRQNVGLASNGAAVVV